MTSDFCWSIPTAMSFSCLMLAMRLTNPYFETNLPTGAIATYTVCTLGVKTVTVDTSKKI